MVSKWVYMVEKDPEDKVLCPKCKNEVYPDVNILDSLKADEIPVAKCPSCNGFLGLRIGLNELLGL